MIGTCPEREKPASFSATTSETPSRASDVASEWTALPGGVVDGGEIVILAIRPSLWRPLFDSAPCLATCCLLAGVLTGFGRPLPGLSIAATAQLILLVGFVYLGISTVRWASVWHVLTNRRILDIQGVRAPRIWSCLLIQTRNTYVHASGVERLTGLGTITFVTDVPDEPPRHWHSIAKPQEVHDRIRRAIENAIDEHGIGG
jgi:hypothetical protein